MSISRDELLHTARLARLELSETEMDTLAREMGSILDYVACLASMTGDRSIEDIPEGRLTRKTPVREDTVVQGLTPEAALEPAPAFADGKFKVPPAIRER